MALSEGERRELGRELILPSSITLGWVVGSGGMPWAQVRS